jgi:alpha-1,2-mannosyltransferase
MSALINPTWWVLCGVLVLLAAAREPAQACRSAGTLLTRTPVLLLIGALALVNVGARGLLGQAVPGDFAQEVVAARQLAAGATLYPADINAHVRAWLAKEPPGAPGWLPAPARDWLDARQRVGRNALAAQAHPPTLLLAAAPLVWTFGAAGAFWILTLGSVVAMAVTASMLLGALAPGATPRQHVLAAMLLLAWQPVLATVRDGQVSAIVAALLVASWWQLRRGHDAAAGAAVGLAAALKLYPLLLVAPLALRSRRAGAVAAASAGGLAVLAACLAPGAWSEYASSAWLIATWFADAPHNLGAAARLQGLPGVLREITFGLAAVFALATSARRVTQAAEPTAAPLAFDLAFGGFVVLALLLSPVAWHHYVCMLVLPVAVLAADARASHRSRWWGMGLAVAALVLSLPDDAWRAVWWRLPEAAAPLVSPGLAAAALWTATVWAGAPTAPDEPRIVDAAAETRGAAR